MELVRWNEPHIGGYIKKTGFILGLVRYGCLNNTGNKFYVLQVSGFSKYDRIVDIYKSRKKPVIRNLYLLNALFIWPILLIYIIAFIVIAALLFITWPIQILIKRTFLTQWYEIVAGWIWIAFALFGIASAIIK